MWIFPLFLIIVIVIFCFSQKQAKVHQLQLTQRENNQKRWLATYNLSNKPSYEWSDNIFVLDEEKNNVYVSNSILADSAQVFLQIPFSQIIGFETLIDNQVETRTTGTVSRALVGGMLAGGAGAIIGATSAKTISTDKVQSLKAVLYLNDLSNPRMEFDLLDSPAQKTDYAFIEARKFAESINASVKVILARNEEAKIQQAAVPLRETKKPLPSPYRSGADKKQPHVCMACGKKPIVAAKINDGNSEVNAFLCEACLRSAAKIAHIRIVASIDARYPVGAEIGFIPEAEPSLDNFDFSD